MTPSTTNVIHRHRAGQLSFDAGGHWLGSFATYLVTGRGLPAREADEGDEARPAATN